MSPQLVMDAIEKILLSMKDEDEEWELWRNFATVRVLAEQLQRWADVRGKPPTALVSEKLLEVMEGATGLAGFSDQEQSRDWHLQTALQGIAKLRHPNLFGRSTES